MSKRAVPTFGIDHTQLDNHYDWYIETDGQNWTGRYVNFREQGEFSQLVTVGVLRNRRVHWKEESAMMLLLCCTKLQTVAHHINQPRPKQGSTKHTHILM